MQTSGSQAIFKRKTPQENCFPVKLPVCFGLFFFLHVILQQKFFDVIGFWMVFWSYFLVYLLIVWNDAVSLEKESLLAFIRRTL